MLFMVIEHYGPGKTVEVYRRFRDRGRLMPGPAYRLPRLEPVVGIADTGLFTDHYPIADVDFGKGD